MPVLGDEREELCHDVEGVRGRARERGLAALAVGAPQADQQELLTEVGQEGLVVQKVDLGVKNRVFLMALNTNKNNSLRITKDHLIGHSVTVSLSLPIGISSEIFCKLAGKVHEFLVTCISSTCIVYFNMKSKIF